MMMITMEAAAKATINQISRQKGGSGRRFHVPKYLLEGVVIYGKKHHHYSTPDSFAFFHKSPPFFLGLQKYLRYCSYLVNSAKKCPEKNPKNTAFQFQMQSCQTTKQILFQTGPYWPFRSPFIFSHLSHKRSPIFKAENFAFDEAI